MKKGMELISDVDNCILHEGEAAFWWLGQQGFVLKFTGVVIYLDPFLTELPERNVPPLLKAKEISHADFILGSHDHGDHIDRCVWPILAKSSPKAKFIVPFYLCEQLSRELLIPRDRFIGLDDGLCVKISGVKITGLAAAHEFLDRDPDTGCYKYLSYVIETNGRTVYHAGDTCIYEGLQSKLKEWEKIDVMFLPINGRDGKRLRENCIGNMTYQEAVDLAGAVKPRLVVPAHYEMFDSNKENPLLFGDYLGAKYPQIDYWIGEHGTRVLVKLEVINER